MINPSERLIVDKCFECNSLHQYMLLIDNKFYLAISNDGLPVNPQQIEEIPENIAKKMIFKDREIQPYHYIMLGLEKKSGYDVRIGRAITKAEFAELKEKLKLTENDISEPFEDISGAIYGEKWEKRYTSIQIAIQQNSLLNEIEIEDEIRKSGIEAHACGMGQINIRIA